MFVMGWKQGGVLSGDNVGKDAKKRWMRKPREPRER